MKVAPERVDALRQVFPDLQVVAEAGADFVYLPKLPIRHAGEDRVVNGLLRPSVGEGYATRLYLSEPLHQRGGNWTQHSLIGKTWHTWSLQGIPAELPLDQMLAAHLRALQ